MLVIIFIAGVVVGCLITFCLVITAKTDGWLHIDRSDQDDIPYMFLELKKDQSSLYKRKYARFKVKTKNYIPQK